MNENIVKSILYLYEAANLQGNTTLKSYYFKKCSIAAKQNKLKLDKKFLNVYSRCPRCLIERDQNNASYKIKAEVKDNFVRKLTEKENLTKFQWKYLKKCTARNHNTMVITCRLCGHSAEKKMEKPVKQEEPKIRVQSAKKKKKRRDKFAGLNANAVMSAKKSGIKELETIKKDKIKRVENMKIIIDNSKTLDSVKTIGKSVENIKTRIDNGKEGENVKIKINNGKKEKDVKTAKKVKNAKKKIALNSKPISVRSGGKVTKKNKNKLRDMFSNKTKASNSLQAFLESI